MIIGRTEFHPVAMVVALVVLTGSAFLAATLERTAHADPKPGLWQEAVTTADGVTVRVIRDTTSGNFNVCYVASRDPGEHGAGMSTSHSVSVAISCLPERKP